MPPGAEDPLPGDPALARLERAEQPGLHPSAVEEAGQALRGRTARHLREDLQRGLRRASTRHGSTARRSPAARPPLAATTRRAERAPSVSPLVFLTGAEEGARALRRLRAPSVLQRAERDPVHAAEGFDRGDPREHQHAPRAAAEALPLRSASGSRSTATRRSRPTGSSGSRTPSRRGTWRRPSRSSARTRASTCWSGSSCATTAGSWPAGNRGCRGRGGQEEACFAHLQSPGQTPLARGSRVH